MDGEREYRVKDEPEHGEPVELAQALGEWAAADHLPEPEDEPRTLVPYSGGDSIGTRFIYPGWYERDAGRAHPGRTYVTEVFRAQARRRRNPAAALADSQRA